MTRIFVLLFVVSILSSCAALELENRGLPKCSGLSRRPLNQDLWDWESKKAKQTGIVRTQFAPEMLEGVISGDPEKVSSRSLEDWQWNVAESETQCGVNHG